MPQAAIAFAGTRDRMEWEAVPKAGYAIHPITVSGFQRGLSPQALARNVAFPFKLAKGLWESARLIGNFDPDVVVGTGGYASGPVGLAASLRGRKLVDPGAERLCGRHQQASGAARRPGLPRLRRRPRLFPR